MLIAVTDPASIIATQPPGKEKSLPFAACTLCRDRRTASPSTRCGAPQKRHSHRELSKLPSQQQAAPPAVSPTTRQTRTRAHLAARRVRRLCCLSHVAVRCLENLKLRRKRASRCAGRLAPLESDALAGGKLAALPQLPACLFLRVTNCCWPCLYFTLGTVANVWPIFFSPRRAPFRRLLCRPVRTKRRLSKTSLVPHRIGTPVHRLSPRTNGNPLCKTTCARDLSSRTAQVEAACSLQEPASCIAVAAPLARALGCKNTSRLATSSRPPSRTSTRAATFTV